MNSFVINKLSCFLLLFFCCSSAVRAESRFIRNEGSDTVIVFVHGILGNSIDTFTAGKTYWPELLKSDNVFDGVDIFVLDYPTTLWGTMSVNELAEVVRRELNGHQVAPRQNIIFLAHSMGGLLVRSYLLKNREIAGHTKFLYFFATPTQGSEVAALATWISSSPQLKGMQPIKSTDQLADVIRDWLSARFPIPSYCAYEKLNVLGQLVVDFPSATALCNQPVDPMEFNHQEIVKPTGLGHPSYLNFRNAFVERKDQKAPLSKEALKGFHDRLKDINRTLMRSKQDLFPAIDRYIANPSQQGWNEIQASAQRQLTDVRRSIDDSLKFDSQFFEVGKTVVRLTDDARTEAVDRRFVNQFEYARQVWQGPVRAIQREYKTEVRPTPQQAQLWRDELKIYYEKLQLELERLLALVRDKTS